MSDDVELLDEEHVEDEPNRALAAVKLRLAGASPGEIAEHLGYVNGRAAQRAVETALARTVPDEKRDHMRQLLSGRLDTLLRAVMGKARNQKHPDQLSAVRAAVAIIDRQAKLHGADRPTEIAVYTPMASEIEQFVAAINAAKMGALPEEADIVDGEVAEDSEGQLAQPRLEGSPYG